MISRVSPTSQSKIALSRSFICRSSTTRSRPPPICSPKLQQRRNLPPQRKAPREKPLKAVETLPKNNYGKVLKTELRQWVKDANGAS